MILNLEWLLEMFEHIKQCPTCYRKSVGTLITSFVFVGSSPGRSSWGRAENEGWPVTLCTRRLRLLSPVTEGTLPSNQIGRPPAALFQNVTLAHLSNYLLRFRVRGRGAWKKENLLKAGSHRRTALAPSETMRGGRQAGERRGVRQITTWCRSEEVVLTLC